MTFCEAEYAEVVVGDFNGDGRADLMCREPEQMLKVFYADKNGRYSGKMIVVSHLSHLATIVYERTRYVSLMGGNLNIKVFVFLVFL